MSGAHTPQTADEVAEAIGPTLDAFVASIAPEMPDWFFNSPRWLGNQLLAICAWNYAYADTMLAERRK